MKKFLVLIAGAAVSYSLVGAAASSLSVVQTTSPSQGSDTAIDTLASCTSSVIVQYEYANSDGTTAEIVAITTGEARYVAAVVIAAADGNVCQPENLDGTAGTDYAAISFPAYNDADNTTGATQPEFLDKVAFAAFEASPKVDGGPLTTASAPDGGWVIPLDLSTGTSNDLKIENFEPGLITVTIWSDPDTTP